MSTEIKMVIVSFVIVGIVSALFWAIRRNPKLDDDFEDDIIYKTQKYKK